MRHWCRVVIVVAHILGAATARAQSVLSGVVSARGDSVVAAADVRIPELRLQTTSDANGRYRLADIPAGRYLVLVRRLGFDSMSVTLAFSGADEVRRNFELIRHAQPLPEVPVTGTETPIMNAKLRQFEERRRYGVGRFLTAADLERDQDKLLSNSLAKLPGIQIVTGRPGKGGGGLAAYVVSSRGSFSIETQSAFFGRKCPMAIWLDGTPVYRGNDQVAVSVKTGVTRSIGMDEPPFDINQIHTRTVAAIEYYASTAQLPAQFNITQGTCGAVIIWTK